MALNNNLKKIFNKLNPFKYEQDVRKSIQDVIKNKSIYLNSNKTLSLKERNILENILSINKLKVVDVMIPRASIISISHDCKLDQIVKIIEQEAHSRIPVYRKDLDDVLGMVHIKDVIRFFSNRNEKYDIAKILKEVLFVPPSMPVLNLLLKMQATQLHMALVIDEHGGTDGLVTIEDLVEEIVGEIQDEHDEDENEQIQRINENKFIVNANISLNDFYKETNIKIYDQNKKKKIDTIGGFVFSLINRVPSNGEIINFENIKFQILDSDPRKIKKIQILKN
ncbi:MAG: ion transporter [Candidatus Pelagibacter sp.]|nr:ion transporter [Candidatus Pelagibacter sp.]OUV98056.1 MAG: ion transporter [Candidatus Pelagibacter sp. TMED142]|tara:strand:- start:42 stop:884 length:843 start_codon:yes stop_codon:yes gene_type:complete